MIRWVAFVYVGVRGSLCLFFAWNPHKGCACEIFHETGRGRGKARSQRRTEEGSGHNRIVNRREQSTEVGESRLLRPVDTEVGLANVRGWFSVPGGLWEFRSNIRSWLLTDEQKVTQKCHKLLPRLCLELTQVRVCLFSFLPPSQLKYVVFCVSAKKCEIPLAGVERNH